MHALDGQDNIQLIGVNGFCVNTEGQDELVVAAAPYSEEVDETDYAYALAEPVVACGY